MTSEIFKNNLNLKFSNDYQKELFATQGDTGRVFFVQVFDENNNVVNIKDLSLDFFISAKGEVTKSEAEIEDAEKGIFKVSVFSTQLKYQGIHQAQFTLRDNTGNKIGSKIFDIHIEQSIENGATVGRNVIVDFEKINVAIELLENSKATLAEAKDTNETLNKTIQNSKKADVTLTGTIKSANNTNETLNTTDKKAKDTNEILNTTDKKAKETDKALKVTKEQAKKADETLTETIKSANNTNETLNNTDKKAQKTNETLNNTNSAGTITENKLKELYSQLGSTETKVKQIIESGDLSKYVTDTKLQEELAKIDVSEQLKKYAKTADIENMKNNVNESIKQINTSLQSKANTTVLTNLEKSTKDLINKKVDKADGKGLSTNDYTNEDKQEVAKIKNKVDSDSLGSVQITRTSGASKWSESEKRQLDYFLQDFHERTKELKESKADKTELDKKADKSAIDELKKSVADGKNLVANAISEKGIATNNTDTFSTIANNVKKIKIGKYDVGDIIAFGNLQVNAEKNLSTMLNVKTQGTDYSTNGEYIYGRNQKTFNTIEAHDFNDYNNVVRTINTEEQTIYKVISKGNFLLTKNQDRAIIAFKDEKKQWAYKDAFSPINYTKEKYIYINDNNSKIIVLNEEGEVVNTRTNQIHQKINIKGNICVFSDTKQIFICDEKVNTTRIINKEADSVAIDKYIVAKKNNSIEVFTIAGVHKCKFNIDKAWASKIFTRDDFIYIPTETGLLKTTLYGEKEWEYTFDTERVYEATEIEFFNEHILIKGYYRLFLIKDKGYIHGYRILK